MQVIVMKTKYIQPVSEITSISLRNSVLNDIVLGTFSTGTNYVDSNTGMFDDDEDGDELGNQPTSLWDD